jgi:hypothetical protein
MLLCHLLWHYPERPPRCIKPSALGGRGACLDGPSGSIFMPALDDPEETSAATRVCDAAMRRRRMLRHMISCAPRLIFTRCWGSWFITSLLSDSQPQQMQHR